MRDAKTSNAWLSRFGWLVFIWAVSVVATAVVAVLFRLIMGLAGLTL
ncbi:DUF2474 family protein [Rhizobium hainanense]|uniref:DUF2474 domain-containing protein n=1 Tax=Rhizobium hainanense TaxID=52131 RepID=A0A1C3WJU6_9HYPH|nr:DUF2474 family protein [Rhizobium hainanense]SCB40220.1 Protein of unknown function [Rhizobium hainanense]